MELLVVISVCAVILIFSLSTIVDCMDLHVGKSKTYEFKLIRPK